MDSMMKFLKEFWNIESVGQIGYMGLFVCV